MKFRVTSWIVRNLTGPLRVMMSTNTLRHRRSPKSVRTVRVGVDTGGTFTDFVFEVNGHLQIFKLASTPADPAHAIVDGLRRIAETTKSDLNNLEVVHGTTVGTNALLQRRRARITAVAWVVWSTRGV